MGAVISICFKRDENDDLYDYDERRRLIEEEQVDEEFLAAKRKEKIEKIVHETISGFVDISAFKEIQSSLPQVDLSQQEYQKDTFYLGNGFSNHSKKTQSELKSLYTNLGPDSLDANTQKKLRSCAEKITKSVETNFYEPLSLCQRKY